jgi:hypothetical protein
VSSEALKMSLKMQGQIAKLDEKIYKLNKRVEDLFLQLEMNSNEGLTEKRLHEITLIKQLEEELSAHGC